MDNSGQLHFGIYNGSTQTADSPASYNDGKWHQVAATLSATAGASLYVDGSLVASNPGAIYAQTYSGWWRMGENEIANWPYEPASFYFNGLIDEVSIYNRPLAPGEIAAIYAAGSAGKCQGLPFIIQPPQSQIGYWGMSVTFSVGVATNAGGRSLSYQWFKGGNPIAADTNSALVLTNLQSADANTYTVGLTNPNGSTTSQPATLIVEPAGVSIALYAGVTIAGVVGQTYGIQSTSNLSTGSWVGQTNITLGVPTQIWHDSQPASQTQSYYRVVAGPVAIP
jgi:hypothetical protein